MYHCSVLSLYYFSFIQYKCISPLFICSGLVWVSQQPHLMVSVGQCNLGAGRGLHSSITLKYTVYLDRYKWCEVDCVYIIVCSSFSFLGQRKYIFTCTLLEWEEKNKTDLNKKYQHVKKSAARVKVTKSRIQMWYLTSSQYCTNTASTMCWSFC